jgi:hypothetical protein
MRRITVCRIQRNIARIPLLQPARLHSTQRPHNNSNLRTLSIIRSRQQRQHDFLNRMPSAAQLHNSTTRRWGSTSTACIMSPLAQPPFSFMPLLLNRSSTIIMWCSKESIDVGSFSTILAVNGC